MELYDLTKNISNINFFKNNDLEIRKIDIGHSGAFTYYVIMNDREYFLKILKNFDINKIKNVYGDYLKSNITIPKLIEYGKLDNNFSYCVYESLGRITLKSKMENMTLEDIYNIGVYIGKENQRLSKNHIYKLNSKELANKYISKINNNYLKFIVKLEKHKKHFTKDEFKILSDIRLKNFIKKMDESIKSEKIVYCHNDIKTNNIMFKDNVLYFIDIENTDENFFYRTLGANIFTIFPKTDVKYAKFYNGVFAGFYNFDIPIIVKDYLILNYLSQMLKKINHNFNRNDIGMFVSDTKELANLLMKSDYFKKFDFSFLEVNKKYELLDIEIKRIAIELNDKYNYKFIKKIDGGYSGAISLLLMKNGQKFFCKIFSYNINVDYIKNICDIYQILKINSLKVLDYGLLFNGQYYFVIYNYIDGICLNNYIYENNLSCNDIMEYGIKAGEIAKKLKEYKSDNEKFFSSISIINETKLIVDNLKLLLNDSHKKSIINSYINCNTFNKLISNFIKYKDSFEKDKINLIHQDLKPANIMISNNEIHIIDVESMALSYNVFDFKCTITWDLIQSYENEIYYLKGYFNGLYNYKIPKKLNQQLKYIFLYDFFRSIIGLLSDNNIDYTKIGNYMKSVCNLITKESLKNIFDFVIT